MSTRFARVVEKASEYGFSGDAFVVSQLEARKLLQRENAAVRRKVKALQKEHGDYFDDPIIATAYKHVCTDLLAWLDERGR